MKKNLLVTLANQKYLDMAKQLFSSVYFNAGWKGDYMLLSYLIPEENLSWFKEKGILVKKCQPIINNIHNAPLPLVFVKFYCFTTEFKKWDNIVFLDADIICQGSLDLLTEIKGFAAAEDTTGVVRYQFVKENEGNRTLFRELKKEYKLSRPSFTAGVMAFSTDIIKEDTFSQLISLTQKYEVIYLTYEQTVLNLFFKEWKRLPIVFNTLDYVLLNILGMGVFKQGVETIVLHLVDGKTYFTSPYPEDLVCKEWRENLEKSELIALDKFVPPKKTWTKKEINKLDLKYKKLYKIWKKAAHNGWRKRSFKQPKLNIF